MEIINNKMRQGVGWYINKMLMRKDLDLWLSPRVAKICRSCLLQKRRCSCIPHNRIKRVIFQMHRHRSRINLLRVKWFQIQFLQKIIKIICQYKWAVIYHICIEMMQTFWNLMMCVLEINLKISIISPKSVQQSQEHKFLSLVNSLEININMD